MNKALVEFIKAGNPVSFTGTSLAIFCSGLKAVQIPLKYAFSESEEDVELLQYYLSIMSRLYKSQEEIAAEEAVRKAKESLKAAEEVLNKVKKEK